MLIAGGPGHAARMGPAARGACETGAQGNAERSGDAARSATNACTARTPGMLAGGVRQGLGLGQACTEEGLPPGMPAAGAHAQQGRLRGELRAGPEGAADCVEDATAVQFWSEGVASAHVGASTGAWQENSQAGPATSIKDGDAGEGWNDFMG